MSWKDKFPKEYRYFETDKGILYCGDCLEIMGNLLEKSVALVITDPPYSKKDFNEWDVLGELVYLLLKENGHFITLCGHYQIIDVGSIISKYLRFWWVGALVGKRSNRIFGKNVITKFKPFLWFLKGKREKSKYVPIDVIEPESHEWKKDYHKWNQPLPFFSEHIKFLSKENDLVLDPFVGSGTTAVAAEKLNRKWIGIEIEEKYCEITKERILNSK